MIKQYLQEVAVSIQRENSVNLARLVALLPLQVNEYNDPSKLAPEVANAMKSNNNYNNYRNSGEESTESSGLIVLCKVYLPPLFAEAIGHHLAAQYLMYTDSELSRIFTEQYSMLHQLSRSFQSSTGWLLKAIQICASDLWSISKRLSIAEMEQTARLINKVFTSCLNDRAPINISRKWGTLYFLVLLFKMYFRLKQDSLCLNIMKAIEASDIPDFERFPVNHLVPFNYYVGLLNFTNEKYQTSLSHFEASFLRLPSQLHQNKRLILDYLIPLNLLSFKYPSKELLTIHGLTVYNGIIDAVANGNHPKYNRYLQQMEKYLLKRRTFMLFEKIGLICYRNLLHKISRIYGDCKMPLDLIRRGMSVGMKQQVDLDETECILCILIEKGLMKGYIAHEKSFLVLSQKDPFPKVSIL